MTYVFPKDKVSEDDVRIMEQHTGEKTTRKRNGDLVIKIPHEEKDKSFGQLLDMLNLDSW